jgi:hypothetical protein
MHDTFFVLRNIDNLVSLCSVSCLIFAIVFLFESSSSNYNGFVVSKRGSIQSKLAVFLFRFKERYFDV